MVIAGYFASVLIGVSLGLIGGGGSILTVPVLVYLFSIDAVIATTYSLFVVGTTSVVGSLSYFRKGLVDVRTAFVFGVPSIASVFFTRRFIVPAIPNEIFSIGSFIVTKSALLLLLFAILMVFASYNMIKKRALQTDESSDKIPDYPLVIMQGLAVGLLTGMVGAGGGFLIIPALVNMLKIPMKKAIGTSLMIISMNSLFGFMVSLNQITIQWKLLLSVTSIAVAGILIGSFISTRIDGKKLKPAFGWFVLVMGIYIIIRETLFS